MLRLFRTLRKKLIDEDNVRKYLLYAIGEVLLVVIGILIALQVNTWNEDRKIANEEQAILTRLFEDLEFAKTQSERFIERENEDIHRLKLVLGSQQELTEILQQPNHDQFFYDAVWDLSFDVPVIITYTDLQNAGDTGKIQNSRLRNRLSEMGLKILMLESIIGDRLSVHQNRIDNIVEYELNYLPLLAADKNLTTIHPGEANNYIQIMQKPNVRNLLGIKLDLTILVLNLRKSLDQKLAQVIGMVQSEIN
ncbi:MAG: hypothetical protein CL666_12100 [Balneola sp.]|nr:hypothetical protein [Balneola sp.]|tara:strand:+ start:235298 stop:236050 length:753 start_codon:yes stop_codon:yes gene_type:complete